MISKKDLLDGRYYIGRTIQRGMPIGRWDSKMSVFVCIKPPEFGQYSIYEMPHSDDKSGEYVCFEPVKLIDTNELRTNKR